MAAKQKDSRWWLRDGREELVVGSTPGDVYDMVADLPRMGDWSPECERVEWVGGSTGPVEGATFVGHNRGGPGRRLTWSRHGRVLAAVPGKEFSFATEEGGRESTIWTYRFEPVAGGTLVIETYDVRWLPAWARIIDGPLNRRGELHRHMRRTLGQLKAAAESTDALGDRPDSPEPTERRR